MTRTKYLISLAGVMLAIALPGIAGATGYANARVARLAELRGEVLISPATSSQWNQAVRNRPLVAGDQLMVGDYGRVALQLGDAALRLDEETTMRFLSLDAELVQVELSRGTVNLRVDEMYGDQVYEIDTPTLAFVASRPGSYRIDVAPSGYGAMVTVFSGEGMVYGADGESRQVYAGRSYRFDDARLAWVDVDDIPRRNAFDRWCASLDRSYANSRSRRHVASNVIGYRDLDRYGDWRASVRYGSVWYPSDVGAGWRPYHDGHWAWVAPWGWTWVDNAPWGFAPFHYGRWAYIDRRWGWVPGPRLVQRAVYAPALVAFIGGDNWSLSLRLGGHRPIGWFPLGPRDIYCPPYRVDRRYFRQVNITNVRYVDKTVINNFYADYHDQRLVKRQRYAFHGNPHAVTVVSRDVFTHARPVARASHPLTAAQLKRVDAVYSPSLAPTVASLAAGPRGTPSRSAVEALDKRLVSHHTPRARPASFAAREPANGVRHGRSVTATQRNDTGADSIAGTAPRGAPTQTVRRNASPDSDSRGMARSKRTPSVAPRGMPRPVTLPSTVRRTTNHASEDGVLRTPTQSPRGVPNRAVQRAQSSPRQPTMVRAPRRSTNPTISRSTPRAAPPPRNHERRTNATRRAPHGVVKRSVSAHRSPRAPPERRTIDRQIATPRPMPRAARPSHNRPAVRPARPAPGSSRVITRKTTSPARSNRGSDAARPTTRANRPSREENKSGRGRGGPRGAPAVRIGGRGE